MKQNVFHNINEIVLMEYNLPYKGNLKTFDSLMPNYNEYHHLYQITIARKYNIKVILVLISFISIIIKTLYLYYVGERLARFLKYIG